jgi:hypothetical protein
MCPQDLCDGAAGATGRLLAEGGNCLCETREGFYWDVVAGALSCDEDVDGWVSYVAYQHQTNAAVYSVSVREQARCEVRSVDRFILQPERAGDTIAEVSAERFGVASIALVETQRNDRASLLQEADPETRPEYAHPPALADSLGGRLLTPQELNPLTKYCVDEQADFNDDGRPDISQGQADDPSAQLTPELARAAAALSYFAELHLGYYLPPDPASGSPFGRYIIAERGRDAAAEGFERVAAAMPNDAGPYWRDCPRFRDAKAERDGARCGKASYDFCAEYDEGTRTGMTHHSQFKCMAVVRPDRRELGGDPEADHLVSRVFASQRFTFNACVPGAGPSSVPAGVSRVNPLNVPFECSVVAADDRVSLGNPNVDGYVGWAVVPYAPYGGQPTVSCADANGNDDSSRCAANVECRDGYCQDRILELGYTRGCVNECEEIDWLNGHDAGYVRDNCGQYRAPGGPGDIDPRFACGVAPYSPGRELPAVPDSGRLVCGCALSYGGEACSIGCGSAGVDGDVLVSADFDLATRDGDWMCASFSAADPEPQVDDGGEWSLTGRVPLSPVQRTEAIQGQSADGTTFTLY